MADLKFDSLTVRYGLGNRAIKAVDDISLVVPVGNVVGLVGESGSGKSSIARAAVGLAPIAGGSICLGDFDLRELRAQRKTPVQMIFQDPFGSLDPRMSIGASIAEAMPGGVRVARKSRLAEIDKLLELVSIDPTRAQDRPDRLSGGQRQRVALARALAGRPEIIIADEVTSALDVSVQGSILNLLRRLPIEMEMGILFISHNLAVVRYVSDFIAVMYSGRIVESGPAQNVLDNPQHPYTLQLLNAAPRRSEPLSVNVPSDPAVRSVLDAEPPDPHTPPLGCRFHTRCPIGPLVYPERQICVDRDPQEGIGGRTNRAACHFARAVGR